MSGRFQPHHLLILISALSVAASMAVAWFTSSPAAGLVVLSTVVVCAFVSFKAAVWKRSVVSHDVVPVHFHSALNGMTEGILIIDYAGNIQYANDSWLKITGVTRDELLNRRARDIPWQWMDSDDARNEFRSDVVSTEVPSVHWLEAVRSGRDRCGRIVGTPGEESPVYILKAAAIAEPGQQPRGALCSLQDVTRLYRKESETIALLKTIRSSSAQIRQQHTELEELADRDYETGCLNRHACFDVLERLCVEATHDGVDFACLLVDIDRFRSINEEYGRQVGDKVIAALAKCLLKSVRPSDLVCRYGGEEFLILMPRTTATDAGFLAERIRLAVARMHDTDVNITISIGVASWSRGHVWFQDLLDLAEANCIEAKRRGGNQVSRELEFPNSAVATPDLLSSAQGTSRIIPFPAVTALISALAFRDIATASHSRRVADLCVAVGQRLMSMRSCYILETAALLHDIGKIGVPDALLHKKTQLSQPELQEIQSHCQMGLEIVRTAFGSPELSSILENASISYEESLARKISLPLGARVLAIADAFDSMVNEQIYRKALSVEEACQEILRCAGTQFDPELVPLFLEFVKTRSRDALPSIQVDREFALTLGLHLERLAEAVDQQDLELLRLLASHLVHTASQTVASDIVDKAQDLERAARTGGDLLGILQKASDLLASVRATQNAYIASHAQTNTSQVS